MQVSLSYRRYFYTQLQWGLLPVQAIVMTSHGTADASCFWRARTGGEGVLQLQTLVVRCSHGHSFLFRHLSVLLQENVLIMLINAFGDGFGIRFEFMKGSQDLALLWLQGHPTSHVMWKMRLQEGLRRGGGGGCCELWTLRQSDQPSREPPHLDTVLQGLPPTPQFMLLWGMHNTAPASVVANVLHSELRVSGQSQVLRTETFSYVYQKNGA